MSRGTVKDTGAFSAGKINHLTEMVTHAYGEQGGCIVDPRVLDRSSRDNLFGSIHNLLGSTALSNYRMLTMTFDGNTVIVAGMSHPRNGVKDSRKSVGEVLSVFEFNHVLSVHDSKSEFTGYKKLFRKQKLAYTNAPIKDFSVPTPKVQEKIIQYARNRAKMCHNFVVHCGEGWGRTGIALCLLYINSDEFRLWVISAVQDGRDITATDTKSCPLGHYAERSPACKSQGDGFECTCTFLLYFVLWQVRKAEEATGTHSRWTTDGLSVETENQLKYLEKVADDKRREILGLPSREMDTEFFRAVQRIPNITDETVRALHEEGIEDKEDLMYLLTSYYGNLATKLKEMGLQQAQAKLLLNFFQKRPPSPDRFIVKEESKKAAELAAQLLQPDFRLLLREYVSEKDHGLFDLTWEIFKEQHMDSPDMLYDETVADLQTMKGVTRSAAKLVVAAIAKLKKALSSRSGTDTAFFRTVLNIPNITDRTILALQDDGIENEMDLEKFGGTTENLKAMGMTKAQAKLLRQFFQF